MYKYCIIDIYGIDGKLHDIYSNLKHNFLHFLGGNSPIFTFTFVIYLYFSLWVVTFAYFSKPCYMHNWWIYLLGPNSPGMVLHFVMINDVHFSLMQVPLLNTKLTENFLENLALVWTWTGNVGHSIFIERNCLN